jgi:hypothetical protein
MGNCKRKERAVSRHAFQRPEEGKELREKGEGGTNENVLKLGNWFGSKGSLG